MAPIRITPTSQVENVFSASISRNVPDVIFFFLCCFVALLALSCASICLSVRDYSAKEVAVSNAMLR